MERLSLTFISLLVTHSIKTPYKIHTFLLVFSFSVMGIKISTLSHKKKKSSSISSVKKTYNFDDTSTNSNNESMFTSGRTFHHVQNSAYWFPNDDEEMDRLIGVNSI